MTDIQATALRDHPPRGFHVAIEGADGTGKTTLVEALHSRMSFPIEGYNGKALTMRQPGSSPYADSVRDIARKANINPVTQTLIYMSAINDSFTLKAIPYLYGDGIVISDRFYGTTFAYQGLFGDQCPLFHSILRNLEVYIPADLTIYLDMPIVNSAARMDIREEKGGVDRYSGYALHTKKRHKAYYDLIHGVPDADVSTLTDTEIRYAKNEILEYNAFNKAKAESLGRSVPKTIVINADVGKEALLSATAMEIFRSMD